MSEFDIKNYRNRWEVVKVVEAKELREASLAQRWKKLNSIARLAFESGISPEPDQSKMEVHKRWAKLRKEHKNNIKWSR